jgi:3-hydroxyisobutyrate dehydrogenase-like beta-hydroxyacid dehydrogenase
MTEVKTVRTGFIGLGSQGAPMAERMLLAGFPLTVWARRPDAAQELVDKGAQLAASVAALGEACDHIGLCVVNDADVLDVCSRLVPAMAPGSLLVIHSTILPKTAAQICGDCTARGVLCLDAPVSGGAPGAQAGTMTVMCGGTQAAFDQGHAVLESFAKLIVLLGAAGAGQKAKIINNTLMGANMGLAQAALAAGEQLGIDRASLAELIKSSSGRSFGFEVYARLPAPQAFAHGGALLLKDANLLAKILPNDAESGRLVATAHDFLGRFS